MLPLLDVDFHLAPFVDPRDHVGVAAARVVIGAPHFERERDFWVRPVRSNAKQISIHLLLRPVEAEIERVLIYPFFMACENIDSTPDWKLLEARATSRFADDKFCTHIIRSRRPTQDCIICYRNSGLSRLHFFWSWSQKNEFHMARYEKLPPTFQLDFGEFVDLTTSEFHGRLEEEWNQPDSHTYSMWKWWRIPMLERSKMTREIIDSSRFKKAKELMTLVLKSEAIYNSSIAESGARWRFCWPEATNGIRDLKHTPRLKKWAEVIGDYLQILETKHTIPVTAKRDSIKSQSVECSPLSYHEMLEARLTLHAWARENLSPSQANELIAPDDLN